MSNTSNIAGKIYLLHKKNDEREYAAYDNATIDKPENIQKLMLTPKAYY